jgi:hypothetical protein
MQERAKRMEEKKVTGGPCPHGEFNAGWTGPRDQTLRGNRASSARAQFVVVSFFFGNNTTHIQIKIDVALFLFPLQRTGIYLVTQINM